MLQQHNVNEHSVYTIIAPAYDTGISKLVYTHKELLHVSPMWPSSGKYNIGRFFPTWQTRGGPKLWWVFIRLSKGYHHCDRLSSFRQRLLNPPETRCMKQRWRSGGPTLNGHAGRKSTLYIGLPTIYITPISLGWWITDTYIYVFVNYT